MAGGIICSVITPHTPRMADKKTAPEFTHGLMQGSTELGKMLRGLKPDLFVLNSTHWISSFNWYATCQDPHEGVCVADEAPNLIPGIPYKRKGDPLFARCLIDLVEENNLPAGLNETPHFNWDYGSLVPLLYLDPESEIPVVLVPTCLSANFEESAKIGKLIQQTAMKTNKRVVFIASTALSHEIVRGPEIWPTEERQKLDFKFVQMLCDGQIEEATDWLPEYHKTVILEMGGRSVAMMLGASSVIEASSLSGQQFGPYGQSSGSGNVSVAVGPEIKSMPAPSAQTN